jgi:hypothetical protein
LLIVNWVVWDNCDTVTFVIDAVTVTVPGGTGVKPDPKAESIPKPAKATTANSMSCNPRRLLKPNRHKRPASAMAGRNGLEPCRRATTEGTQMTVSCTLVEPLEGVTSIGVKLHIIPLDPEQEKTIWELKPLIGVTLRTAEA